MSNRLFFVAALFPFFITAGHADTLTAVPEDKDSKPKVASIYFSAEVNNKTISELGVALNRVAVNYPSVKRIDLVINSKGGDADAGKLGYTMVKSSPIPVHAINGGLTASAASLLFCSAKERAAVPGAVFVLHAVSVEGYSGMKPDALQRMGSYIESTNDFLRLVYKQCTTLSDDEMAQMLKAEYFAKYMDVAAAKNIQLVTSNEEKIPPSGASFFIN